MERVWLDSYTEGTPHEIDPDTYPSLVAIIDEAIARFPDRPAFENMGVRITFAELDRLAKDFTGFLAARGLAKGDRVAVMMPNVLQYPVALVGALRAGLVVVNTNPLYTVRELRHQLVDSGARAIVVLENFGHVLEECIDDTEVQHVVVTGLGDMLGFPKSKLVNFVVRYVKKLVPRFEIDGAVRWADALAEGRGASSGTVELTGEDLAFLQYTGGTTGVSKGAMLTHRNMVANILQADGFLRPFAREGEEVIITALPLYHIFALAVNCMTYMRFGALSVLITNPRDMPGFVKTLKGVRFTVITGVNTLFNGLMNTSGFSDLDFSPMRISVGGGMAVQSAVAERWKAMTGIALLEGYGLTETSPCACMNPLHIDDYTGTVGAPMASTECRVIDDSGNPLPVDTPGELLRSWSPGDAGVLEPARGDRRRDRRRGLAAHRRRRPDGCARVLPHRGSEEGHDSRVGVQRVSERDRRGPLAASGGAGGRRHRRARRAQRGGCQDHRREAFTGTDGGGVAGVQQGAPHRLQASPAHRIHPRAPEDQRGQGPAPCAARPVRFNRRRRAIVGAAGRGRPGLFD